MVLGKPEGFRSMLKNRASFGLKGTAISLIGENIGSSPKLMKNISNKAFKSKLSKHVEEIPISPKNYANGVFETNRSPFRHIRKLSNDFSGKDPMSATVKKNKLKRLKTAKENKNEFTAKKLKRNKTLLIKNQKGTSISKEATPKIKDKDMFQDTVKNGYSQTAKGDSIISHKTSKSKNGRNLLKDPKFQQNVYVDKGNRNIRVPPDEGKHWSAETKEVNRIFSVLQNNLISPQCGKIGMAAANSGQDPKRTQVRQQLQKHLQLKEQEMQQSNILPKNRLGDDTLILKINDVVPQMLQGISGLMQNLEEESKFSHFNGNAQDSCNFQASKQDSFERAPDETFNTATAKNFDDDEMSVQFQNISRISSSSDSEKIKETGDASEKSEEGRKNNTGNLVKGTSEMDLKKMKTMLAMAQVYRMVKSDNPFDFRQMLQVWSLLKKT